MVYTSRLVLAFLLAFCATSVLSHSYMTSPTSRSNQKGTQSGCRGPSCLGPCDVTFAQARTAPVTIARGASISVQWPRNNHAGGFIRLAWASTSGSGDHANFDAGVQTIVCHEVGGCRPDSAGNPNGGDSGPGDGSSRACTAQIQVPLHLTDGSWTLQWAWFGGAFALGDYYSCADYKISGGPTGSKASATFVGGDYSYPGQNKCKFFNTDRLHMCVNEPCNNPILPGERSGPAYMGIEQQPSSTTTTTTTARPTTTTTTTTTARPTTTTTTTTTARPTTTTTSTSSSGRLTTAKPSITSGAVVIPSTTTTGGSGGSVNCAGLTQPITTTAFRITTADGWGGNIRIIVTMTTPQTVRDWMVQIIFPEGAVNTQITSVYNAGVLRCTASFPTIHAMIAPSNWAVNLNAGQQYSFEFSASNTNMNVEFLKNNVKFAMFQR